MLYSVRGASDRVENIINRFSNVENIIVHICTITTQKYLIIDSGGNRTSEYNCHGSLVAKNLRKSRKMPVFWHSKS